MTPIFDIKELIALMRAGTSELAIPHLEYITQKLPTHVAAHALLAQAYTNERRFEEARIAWQNALFLMPNSPSIQKGFRRVLKELAKQSLAQQNFRAATPLVSEPIPESLPEELLDAEEESAEDIEETNDIEETEGVEEINDIEEAEETEKINDAEETEEINDIEEIKAVEEAPELPEQLFQSGDEMPSLPEELLKNTDQDSPITEEAPSMMVNPSSHHDATPVEIDAVTPLTTEPDSEEPNEAAADDTFVDHEDFPLPVITVPTPNSGQSPGSSKELPDIPVPPILAPLLENSEEWHEDQELDHLIQELESARIIPKPDHEHVEAPQLEDNIDDMVSETLARIFEGQKQYTKAADMYEKLATLHPERSKKFEAKAAELRTLPSDTSDEIHETNSDES